MMDDEATRQIRDDLMLAQHESRNGNCWTCGHALHEVTPWPCRYECENCIDRGSLCPDHELTR